MPTPGGYAEPVPDDGPVSPPTEGGPGDESAPSLQESLWMPPRPPERVPMGKPTRFAALVLGSVMLVLGLLGCGFVALSVAREGLSWLSGEDMTALLLTVLAMPFVGAVLLRSGWKGRDLLEERSRRNLAEWLERQD